MCSETKLLLRMSQKSDEPVYVKEECAGWLLTYPIHIRRVTINIIRGDDHQTMGPYTFDLAAEYHELRLHHDEKLGWLLVHEESLTAFVADKSCDETDDFMVGYDLAA